MNVAMYVAGGFWGGETFTTMSVRCLFLEGANAKALHDDRWRDALRCDALRFVRSANAEHGHVTQLQKEGFSPQSTHHP